MVLDAKTFLLAIVIVAAVIAVVILAALLSPKKEKFAFKLKKTFLSRKEKEIFIYLVNEGYIPCPKVRVADFMYKADKKESISKISQRSVDFLVCADDFKPVFAVLIRKSSDRKANANMYLKSLLDKAGLPAYLVSDEEDLKKQLEKAKEAKKAAENKETDNEEKIKN